MTNPTFESLFAVVRAAVPRFVTAGRVLAISGGTVEATLHGSAIGDLVTLERRNGTPPVSGQILASRAGRAFITLYGSPDGIRVGAAVHAASRAPGFIAGTHLLGTVLDARGQILRRLQNDEGASKSRPHAATAPKTALGQRQAPETSLRWCTVHHSPPPVLERMPLTEPLTTGIRAIDTCLPLAFGQRIAVLAEPGVGKSTLLTQLASGCRADVTVVALVGERGREVAERIELAESAGTASRMILVVSTSDDPPALRASAASLALRIAEMFRDAGLSVLFQCDSLTRYVRALRELALAAGEPPVRRGYPASVFTALPPFLERIGRTRTGSITGVLTMLLSADIDDDPMVEEAKSLLDGHITLRAELASRGHFPAIDLRASLSRVAGRLVSEQQRHDLKAILETLSDLAEYEESGLFGSDLTANQRIAQQHAGALEAFLAPPGQGAEAPEVGRVQLHALAEAIRKDRAAVAAEPGLPAPDDPDLQGPLAGRASNQETVEQRSSMDRFREWL